MNSTLSVAIVHIRVNDLPLSRAGNMAWVVISPLILLFGTFGNVMAIVVLSRLSRRGGQSTVYFYLITLAIADIALLYSGLLRRWLVNQFDYDILVTNDFMCKSLEWMTNTSGALSAWLLVAVTLQRAVSVVFPHRVASLITPRRMLTVLICMTCTLMILNGHFLFGWGILVGGEQNGTVFKECWRLTEDYNNFMDRNWSFIDFLVFSLAPFTILLVSNIVLLRTVMTSVRELRRRLDLGDTQQMTSRKKAASSMTTTLLALSFTFLILTGPICAYLLMKPYVFDDVSNNYEKEAVRRFFHAIINLMWYSNSAINFYLYCLSGSRFRMEFKKFLSCNNSGVNRRNEIISNVSSFPVQVSN